jgi:hypothetical protein
MEAAGLSETLVFLHNSAWNILPEDVSSKQLN